MKSVVTADIGQRIMYTGAEYFTLPKILSYF